MPAKKDDLEALLLKSDALLAGQEAQAADFRLASGNFVRGEIEGLDPMITRRIRPKFLKEAS